MAGNISDINLILIQQPLLGTNTAERKVKETAALVHQMLAVITLCLSLLSTVLNLQPAIYPDSEFSLEFLEGYKQ